MASKIEFGPVALGEIDRVLHNQGVSDLSWLAVDEAEYRAQETLPKQNLDIIPELQKALAFTPDDAVPSVIPMKPHVIVNRNPVDVHAVSSSDVNVPINNRVASLLIKKAPPDVIKEKLSLEFSPADLKLASSHISERIQERGLLGNVYIKAEDFPRCSQRDESTLKLVNKHAAKSLFVIASNKCTGCVCNSNGRCSVFKKTITNSVKYDSRLASHYFPDESIQGSPDQIRSTMQSLFIAGPRVERPDGIKSVATQQIVEKPVFTEEQIQAVLSRKQEKQVVMSTSYVKYARRMMEGKDDRDFLVASGDSELTRLASDFGILGHSYVDMDAIGNCKETLAHIQSFGANPVYILRRSSVCSTCKCLSDGACAKLSKRHKIVQTVPFDRQMLATALNTAVATKRMASETAYRVAKAVSDKTDFKKVTAFVNLMKPVSPSVSTYKGAGQTAHTAVASQKIVIDESELSSFISRCLNDGLTGSRLANAIKSRYSTSALVDMKHVSDRYASEVGLQGHYYIDPTAYSDYGRGCEEGSKKFRKQGPKNLIASSSCSGCTLQTAPGWCSKYCKTIIRSVPSAVRSASDNAKKLLPVVAASVAPSDVEKFGLSKDLPVDSRGFKSKDLDIEMNMPEIDT